jgi:hypothetical protein
MNEKIRELVKQAGGHFSTRNLMSNPVQHRESIELWDDRIEKFAELIVRECANICDDLQDIPATEPRHCAEDIRIHFGLDNK